MIHFASAPDLYEISSTGGLCGLRNTVNVLKLETFKFRCKKQNVGQIHFFLSLLKASSRPF